MIFYTAIGTNGKTLIVATQAEAKALNKDSFAQIDVPTDKAGLMAWIQTMLDMTLNADPAPQDVNEERLSHTEVVIPVVQESVSDRAVRFEDEWENFPLKLKCHFASLAMEECRSILK